MKTLSISISDTEFNKFGLKNNQFTFSDFVDLISNELARQNLDESIKLAEKYGLSDLTMDDINQEVKAVRNNAKNHS